MFSKVKLRRNEENKCRLERLKQGQEACESVASLGYTMSGRPVRLHSVIQRAVRQEGKRETAYRQLVSLGSLQRMLQVRFSKQN